MLSRKEPQRLVRSGRRHRWERRDALAGKASDEQQCRWGYRQEISVPALQLFARPVTHPIPGPPPPWGLQNEPREYREYSNQEKKGTHIPKVLCKFK